MTSIKDTNSETMPPVSESAHSQAVVKTAPSVLTVRTTEELNSVLATLERRATDLVNSDVVREGYMVHGHPAELGFQHLASMTTSRLKKRFPLFDRTEPLFRILWVQGRVIVGEELVNKYKARSVGDKYDYTKAIDTRFAEMFEGLEKYRAVVARLTKDGSDA